MAVRSGLSRTPLLQSNNGFWFYQSFGWALFLLLQLLLLATDEPLSLVNVIPALLFWLLAFAGSLLLRALFRPLRQRQLSVVATLGWLSGYSLVAALLVDVLHYLLLWPLSQLHLTLSVIYDAQPIGAKFPLLLPLYLFWSTLYLTLSRQQDLRFARMAQQESELRMKESQLQSLLAQLSPHFMFNCINNIRALILEDPTAARAMLAHFADMLRYQIDSDLQVLVPLRTELQILADYEALMRIQLEHKLQVNYQLDPACLSRKIPKLALQLLFENAIKHGISRLPQGGVIQLTVLPLGEHGLQLELRNSGQLHQAKTTEHCTGSGLLNLRSRLLLLYGDAASLSLYQQGDEVVAELLIHTLPVIQAGIGPAEHQISEVIK